MSKKEQSDEVTDLFETPELIPSNVQAVLGKYEHCENDYHSCEALLAELEAIGYTIDYGLDAVPSELRPLEGADTLEQKVNKSFSPSM